MLGTQPIDGPVDLEHSDERELRDMAARWPHLHADKGFLRFNNVLGYLPDVLKQPTIGLASLLVVSGSEIVDSPIIAECLYVSIVLSSVGLNTPSVRPPYWFRIEKTGTSLGPSATALRELRLGWIGGIVSRSGFDPG